MSEATEMRPAHLARHDSSAFLRRGLTAVIGQPDIAATGVVQRAAAGQPMPRGSRPSAAEFRRLMLALVRTGRSPEAFSGDFEPIVEEIWKWVIQVAWVGGRKADGLTSAEREELGRLRLEVRCLRAACGIPGILRVHPDSYCGLTELSQQDADGCPA